MKIGQLAELSGMSIDTIRFYEKQGLIPPPERTRSNYRSYPEGTERRLVFIRKARNLGFTLQEIGQLLTLSEDCQAESRDVRERAQQKLRDLDARIQEMERMRQSLARLVQACSGHGPRSQCPILEALSDDE